MLLASTVTVPELDLSNIGTADREIQSSDPNLASPIGPAIDQVIGFSMSTAPDILNQVQGVFTCNFCLSLLNY